MEPTLTPAPTATSGVTIPAVSLDVTNPFQIISDSLSGLLSFAGILGFLAALWSFYTILAYLVSIILLVLYVYASVQKNQYYGLQTQMLRDAEKLYDEQFRGVARSSRLQDVFNHSDSNNPNDWKLAIIEADIILEDALKQKGYPGTSLGERLKNISIQQLGTLQDAWEAHKIRNRIAHDGADFVLTKRIAEETIKRYQRVFSELGVS
jgi:uncharacterized membrane protein